MKSGSANGIAVIGSGYVGTVVAACMAGIGHHVVAVEIDPEKLETLSRGSSYFYEPKLDARLGAAMGAGRLSFTDDFETALDQSEIVFLCVDTPLGSEGYADITQLTAAAESIGRAMRSPHIIVTKSTVPVGSGDWLETLIEEALPEDAEPGCVSVVSNPEFLREGNAVDDFEHPDRIVIGGNDEEAIRRVADAYQPIIDQSFDSGKPERRPALVITDRPTAEMVKYAANAFLATKISFINEIAEICESVGADVDGVAHAIGLDWRISPQFLKAGIGWGGSCFSKDVAALAAKARDHGQQTRLLQAIQEVNQHQRQRLVGKLEKHLGELRGARIALLGLAFKPNTDDLRDAPAVTIAGELLGRGADVRAYDPMVKRVPGLPDIEMSEDAYASADGADAVVLLTEWQELRELNFQEIASQMRGSLVIDGRNALDTNRVLAAGLTYEGMGRTALSEKHPIRAW